MVPFVHYWWPCLPANLAKETFKKLPVQYQMTFRVAHHFPWLINWWMSKKWSILNGNLPVFSPQDLEIVKKLSESPIVGQVVDFLHIVGLSHKRAIISLNMP